ncbi:MAG: putative bifunctional diguanylate cyclase/phosphodiesterase [Pedobacter sp.]
MGATLNNQSNLFCIVQPDGLIIAASSAWETMLGYPSAQHPRPLLQNLLLPSQKNRWQQILAKLQEYPATSALLACQTRKGQTRYLQGHFTHATPALQGAIRATFQDITSRFLVKLQTRQCLRMMQDMAEANLAAFVMLDHQGLVRDWSPRATALFGYDRKEMLRQNLHAILAPWQDQAHPEHDWPHFFSTRYPDQPRSPRKVICRCKDGSTLPAELWLSSIATHNRQYTIGVFTSPKNLQPEKSHIEQLAYYDQLTGLPNRALLDDRITQALAEANRFNHSLALLFVDLDRFKQVNDTLGHAIGDELLKIAGQRLQQCLRSNDTVARFGGDEFIILLSGFRDQANLPRILEKILTTLSKEYRINNHHIAITASIGVAVFPDDGISADLLLRNADTAMYVAKEERGNSYQLFSPEMNQALVAQLELENQLHRAVNNREFFLLFQPRYELATQQPVAVEAFLRWRHPNGSIVSPETFLPRLEEMGLMAALGNSILRKACDIAAGWQQPGRCQLPVAVNLSCSQFRQSDLATSIAGILRETGLPPDCLELEINEPTLQKTADRAEGILHSVKDLGVRWSLDNFGMGYTSLQQLKTLPFDYLKIHRLFIQNLPHSQSDAAMVGAMLAMARNLGLVAIAQGIETFAQHHLLLAMGCLRGQGFLFHKPCLAEALNRTLLYNSTPRLSSALVNSGPHP